MTVAHIHNSNSVSKAALRAIVWQANKTLQNEVPLYLIRLW